MSDPTSESASLFTPQELHEWQLALAEADRYNIFCHCRKCDREWVASSQTPCICGSTKIEYIACWQFPDG